MKILYSNSIFFLQKSGGISRYFINLSEKLLNYNVKTLIVAPLSKNIYLNNLSKNKCSIYLKKIPDWKFLEKLNNFISYILYKKFNPDVVHETYYSKYSLVNFINKKKVITIYDLIHEKFKKIYYKKMKNNKYDIIKLVDHFICISKNTQKDFTNYYGIPKEKTSVIYLGGDHLKNKYKKYKNKNLIGEKYILYVGSREKYKNFKILVLSINSSEEFKNYKIVCFGGGKFSNFEVEKYEIDERFINLQGDDLLLRNLYLNAEVYINTSNYEGFGITNLEAMSLGCPVITSDIQVFKEICGNSCLYFKKNDHSNLTNKIRKVLFNKSFRNKFIRKGYNRSRKYTWEKCAKKTFHLYRSLKIN